MAPSEPQTSTVAVPRRNLPSGGVQRSRRHASPTQSTADATLWRRIGAQIELLRSAVRHPIIVNQLQLSLSHHHLINEGVTVNQTASTFTGTVGLLEYCRLQKILVQAWSPTQGTFEGGRWEEFRWQGNIQARRRCRHRGNRFA